MKIQSTAQSPNAFSTELSEIKTFILTYDVLNLATIFLVVYIFHLQQLLFSSLSSLDS